MGKIMYRGPVAARSKACVFGRSLAEIAGSSSAGVMDTCLLWVLYAVCVGLLSCPEESYRVWRVWVWSWSLDNEETLAHSGRFPQGGGGILAYQAKYLPRKNKELKPVIW
jgi:hypothetical protein